MRPIMTTSNMWQSEQYALDSRLCPLPANFTLVPVQRILDL